MRITTLANPRQVILVTTRAEGKDNIIALSWHTPLSFEPMLYAISVGKTRHSLELLRKSKCFVVNFMDKKFENQIWYCGSHTGKKVDKFKETGLEKEEAQTINSPIIKQCLGYLECQIIKEIEVGDHILFIGQVKKCDLKKEGKRLFHLHQNKFTSTLD